MSLEDNASWFSTIFMLFLDQVFEIGARRKLELDDLGETPLADRCDLLCERFEKLWKIEMTKPEDKQSLWRVIWGAIGYRGVGLGLGLFALSAAFQFGPVLILKVLVAYFSGVKELSTGVVWTLVGLLLVFPTISSLTLAHSNAKLAHVGGQVRGLLIMMIYRKSLVLSSTGRTLISTGRIVTMFSEDTTLIRNFLFFLAQVVFSPIQIAVAMYLIYLVVGSAMFAGLGFSVVSFPMCGILFYYLGVARRQKMVFTDMRVKLMNEILEGIRIIKYYAWELAVMKQLDKFRVQEVKLLSRIGYLLNGNLAVLLIGAPIIQTILIFWMYVSLGEQLDTATAFTTLTLFGIMTTPFIFLPYGLQIYQQQQIASDRIKAFLKGPEINNYIDTIDDSNENIIVFDKASFGWNLSKEDEEKLPAFKEQRMKQKQQQVRMPLAAVNADDYGEEGVELGVTNAAGGDASVEDIVVEDIVVEDPPQNLDRSIYTLTNLNISIKKHSLVAIVGSVGCGKSSFLSALLGEMTKLSGSISMAKGVQCSYCDQRPWIMNADVKNNITFGREYDETRLNRAIYAACMNDDLKLLPGGVLTEIGERGINLSGGQKARVAFARAVYNDADVYLLDDPLSAVDATVGHHIFETGIREILAGKTRILVTHHIQVLPLCDHIIVLEDGTVRAQGTFDDILRSGIDITRYQPKSEDDEEAETPDDSPSTRALSVSGAEKEEVKEKKLITKEERKEGDVTWNTYERFIVAGGVWIFGTVIMTQLIAQVLTINAGFWLVDWGKETTFLNDVQGQDMSLHRDYHWLGGYAGMQLSALVFFTVSRMTIVTHRKHSCSLYHNSLLSKVMHAPISFFDVTPVGRIVNRFSADMLTIDDTLSHSFSQVIGIGGQCLGCIGAVIGATKGIFLILILPLAILYQRWQAYFRASNTAIARLDAVTRSPIYADFSQALGGIATIRAYKQQNEFVKKLERYVNTNTVPTVFLQVAIQWLAIRLDFIGALIVVFIAALAVGAKSNELIPAGFLALGLSYGIQLTSTLKMLVRHFSTAEAQMNSVERFNFYLDVLQDENLVVKSGGNEPEKDNDVNGSETVLSAPQSLEDWPSEGLIEFKDVCMSYRDGPLVLKNVSFTVEGHQKIGIAGRTGCGKSSLMVALFRVEPLTSGRIIIDGVDIAKIPLQTLRSKLCMIPQDPVMFSASVRFNLDPFDEHSDHEIWEVLQIVSLRKHIESLPNKLNELVSEGGDNFSAGQRQLVCMARALLRNPKILVMDEATASIDPETDAFIQKMIREKFSNCTVLTIAHRLDTILDSDCIMMMKNGHLAEKDSPAELLSNSKYTLFKEMYEKHCKQRQK